jgi:hypothetical protein
MHSACKLRLLLVLVLANRKVRFQVEPLTFGLRRPTANGTLTPFYFSLITITHNLGHVSVSAYCLSFYTLLVLPLACLVSC